MSQQPFLFSMRNAGIHPDDDAETRLKKSLLIFATGLVCLGSMLWLFLYGQMGPQFSATPPFVFQILLVCNLLFFFRSGNFDFFRYSQLALFLFAPFAVQWSIGNFITASGTSLWGLLAPIGAVLFFGPRESIAWFIAYIFLTALSGFFDYFLADSMAASVPKVATRTSVFFFALNFAAISSIVYLLLRYSVQEKAKAQASLEATHQLLQEEQERSERLLLNILPGPVAERLKHDKQTIARLCRRYRDVCRHCQFHQDCRRPFATTGFRDAQPDFFILRRTRRAAWGGKDQDHRRCLHGCRWAQQRTDQLLEIDYRVGPRHARTSASRLCDQQHAPRSADRHRHRADRRRRGRQEEVHLRPVGRHRQLGQPDHQRRGTWHDSGRRNHTPPAG